MNGWRIYNCSTGSSVVNVSIRDRRSTLSAGTNTSSLLRIKDRDVSSQCSSFSWSSLLHCDRRFGSSKRFSVSASKLQAPIRRRGSVYLPFTTNDANYRLQVRKRCSLSNSQSFNCSQSILFNPYNQRFRARNVNRRRVDVGDGFFHSNSHNRIIGS
jgi:hypothetical protein